MDNAQLIATIKLLCKQKNKSLKSLREYVGVSHSYFYDLERRGNTPTFEIMVKIARFLECSLDELASMVEND